MAARSQATCQPTAPSGGRIAYNHRGGPNGGQEVCFWPDSFPNAVYGFSALSNSRTASADVRFNAFLDGEKISLYTFAEDGTLVRSKGIRRTLPPEGTASNIVLAPPNAVFEEILPESPDETLDARATQSGQATASAATPAASARQQARAARAARAASKAAAKAAAKSAAKPAAPRNAARPSRQNPPRPLVTAATGGRTAVRKR